MIDELWTFTLYHPCPSLPIFLAWASYPSAGGRTGVDVLVEGGHWHCESRQVTYAVFVSRLTSPETDLHEGSRRRIAYGSQSPVSNHVARKRSLWQKVTLTADSNARGQRHGNGTKGATMTHAVFASMATSPLPSCA